MLWIANTSTEVLRESAKLVRDINLDQFSHRNAPLQDIIGPCHAWFDHINVRYLSGNLKYYSICSGSNSLHYLDNSHKITTTLVSSLNSAHTRYASFISDAESEF
jgi:hypothetical protein